MEYINWMIYWVNTTACDFENHVGLEAKISRCQPDRRLESV
jgi:hypothetical protein